MELLRTVLLLLVLSCVYSALIFSEITRRGIPGERPKLFAEKETDTHIKLSSIGYPKNPSLSLDDDKLVIESGGFFICIARDSKVLGFYSTKSSFKDVSLLPDDILIIGSWPNWCTVAPVLEKQPPSISDLTNDTFWQNFCPNSLYDLFIVAIKRGSEPWKKEPRLRSEEINISSDHSNELVKRPSEPSLDSADSEGNQVPALIFSELIKGGLSEVYPTSAVKRESDTLIKLFSAWWPRIFTLSINGDNLYGCANGFFISIVRDKKVLCCSGVGDGIGPNLRDIPLLPDDIVFIGPGHSWYDTFPVLKKQPPSISDLASGIFWQNFGPSREHEFFIVVIQKKR